MLHPYISDGAHGVYHRLDPDGKIVDSPMNGPNKVCYDPQEIAALMKWCKDE